jgi:hypothetical protein
MFTKFTLLWSVGSFQQVDGMIPTVGHEPDPQHGGRHSVLLMGKPYCTQAPLLHVPQSVAGVSHPREGRPPTLV